MRKLLVIFGSSLEFFILKNEIIDKCYITGYSIYNMVYRDLLCGDLGFCQEISVHNKRRERAT